MPLFLAYKASLTHRTGSAPQRQPLGSLWCSECTFCVRSTTFRKSHHLPIHALSFPPTNFLTKGCCFFSVVLLQVRVLCDFQGHCPFLDSTSRYANSTCPACTCREMVDNSAASSISIAVSHPDPEMRHSEHIPELGAVASASKHGRLSFDASTSTECFIHTHFSWMLGAFQGPAASD